jgi:hypothetical protein
MAKAKVTILCDKTGKKLENEVDVTPEDMESIKARNDLYSCPYCVGKHHAEITWA